jgi:hypothetical protein
MCIADRSNSLLLDDDMMFMFFFFDRMMMSTMFPACVAVSCLLFHFIVTSMNS